MARQRSKHPRPVKKYIPPAEPFTNTSSSSSAMAQQPQQRVKSALAPGNTVFSPAKAISKYPYNYIKDRDLREDIGSEFFGEGRFWARGWDVYYVWPPHGLSDTPLCLIRTDKVSQMLREINEQFNCNLSLDSKSPEAGLALEFPNHPDLRPRYLGSINTRQGYKELELLIPSATWRPDDEVEPKLKASDEDYNSFRHLVDIGLDAGNALRKLKKQQKELEQISKRAKWTIDLETLEGFLGLRPKHRSSVLGEATNPTIPTTFNPPPIDPNLPPPYSFTSSPIFVCTDLEHYERDASRITEIGLAVLDTRLLHFIAPGPIGQNWHSSMKAVHLRIKENAHLTNHEFVQGCAGRFQFGDSEFVSLRDAPGIVASYFRGAAFEGVKEGGSRRTVVLVGHDVKNDVSMLRKLGFDVYNMPGLITLDTAVIYRAYKGLWNSVSLGSVLEELAIEPWFLHNAGNDAVYTLQALIGLAVRSASERGLKEGEERKEGESVLEMKEVTEALQAATDTTKNKRKVIKVKEYVTGLVVWDSGLDGSRGGDSDGGFELQDSRESSRVATYWTPPSSSWW